MRAIDLDFRKPRSAASRWAGPLLLAVAVAVLADVGVSYRAERERFAMKSAHLAKLEPRSRGEAIRNASPEALAHARDTIERLALPWDNLFTALESAATDQVTLLAIEPDPKAGTVIIAGDGKDYLAALSYVLNLSRMEGLRAVHLLRHEIRPQDPQRTVGFAVSAAWKGVKP